MIGCPDCGYEVCECPKTPRIPEESRPSPYFRTFKMPPQSIRSGMMSELAKIVIQNYEARERRGRGRKTG